MMRGMRQLGLWLTVWLAAGTARAAIFADFETSQGTFTVEIDAVRAPRAAANFLGLADGTQTWRDPVTGAVRGGAAGDGFYEGMSFDSTLGTLALLGGLRTRPGGVEGPGYTILDEATNGVALVRGVLALAELEGPHSGGGELALVLSNAMATAGYEWTGFGAVTGAGMAVVEAIAAEVTNGSGRVAAKISIRDEEMTSEETAALAAAQSELPEVAELPLGFGRVSNVTTRASFWSVAKSRACLSIASNLLAASWSVLPGVWNTGTNKVWMDIPLTSIPGVGNQLGFLYGSQAVYPKMTAEPFSGKMRMAVAHTGIDVQYWLDFTGGTGIWAIVEGGEPVYVDSLKGLGQEMATANSVYISFLIGSGLDWTLYCYWLGLDEEGATTGRFYNEQWHMNVILVGVDWGTFELGEGWGKRGTKNAWPLAVAPSFLPKQDGSARSFPADR